MRVLRESYDELRPVLAQLVARRTALAELMDQRYDPAYREKWTRLVEEEEAFVKKALQ